jgi:hypothetical protein
MSKAQLVITAVVLEGRSKSEVARDYNVSRYWVLQLVKRYETEGAAAFEPHSRRPHRNPRAVGADLEDKVVRLRWVLRMRFSLATVLNIRWVPASRVPRICCHTTLTSQPHCRMCRRFRRRCSGRCGSMGRPKRSSSKPPSGAIAESATWSC